MDHAKDDISDATSNDLDADLATIERRIKIQLNELSEQLNNNVTSPLRVPEVKEDKLKTAVKLDLLTRLSESLQEIYSDIQRMVTETCKCDEDVKRDFYDFAYHGLRAEHNDLVHRVNDLESALAEMSDEEKKEFERLQTYQTNRQRQVERLEKLWRGLFTSVRIQEEQHENNISGKPYREGGRGWYGLVLLTCVARLIMASFQSIPARAEIGERREYPRGSSRGPLAG